MRIDRTAIHHSDPARGELRRYRGDHGAHVHAHTQVLLGLEGCLDVEVEGRSMLVDAAAGHVVPAGAVHGSSARFGADVWVIDAPASREFERVRPFALGIGRPDGVSAVQWLEWVRSARRALPRRRLDTVSLQAAVADALHEDWPAARLAAHFSLSVPQFHVCWRDLTGMVNVASPAAVTTTVFTLAGLLAIPGAAVLAGLWVVVNSELTSDRDQPGQ